MTAERVEAIAWMLPDTAPLVPMETQRPKQAKHSEVRVPIADGFLVLAVFNVI
jgi:hypothetical protein